ncbi:hypothetical protein [Planctobacterium marinum]|uniref:hypothetical protein n=1 Tax=Planctobacterium marinum TaxID=1631968 RepID=UPI001E64D765|nr:hypothetical protein [Planctobacterium marinum]MCC2605446.1 hypothetical protein [Planctobacterium marinum]
MNINATLYGKVFLVLAIFMAVFCYYFGKRKTQTPVVTSVLGFFTAIFPPLALIFLIVLVLKDDLPPKD